MAPTDYYLGGLLSVRPAPIPPEALVPATSHRPSDSDIATRGAGVRELGHLPVRSAFRRPTVPTNAIGVVMNEAPTRPFSNPMLSTLLAAFSDAITQRSLLMVMLAPKSTQELELAETYLIGGHIDGAILVGLHSGNPLPNRLREHGIPAVLCGHRARGNLASCIDCNNRRGAEMAVEHLVSLGRRRIATISGDLDRASAFDRRMGYRDALVAAGIDLDPTLEEVADYLPDRAQMAMERLMLNHPEVDAVFAASDLMASAAIRVIQATGKRVPEDVAVVGFDDSPLAAAANPPLTTVRQPLDEMGHEALNLLMLEMHDPTEAPREVILTTELIVRESTVGARAMGAVGQGQATAREAVVQVSPLDTIS